MMSIGTSCMMSNTVEKLIVEVIDARNLLPKDGHGTSSPYVILYFNGQLKRTQTAVRDLNPTWNQVFEFNVLAKNREQQQHEQQQQPQPNIIEINIFHDLSYGLTERNHFLGRVRLTDQCFVMKKGEEALINYYPLQKKHNLFTWVQGEIGLKIYFVHVIPSSSPPPQPPPLPPPNYYEQRQHVNANSDNIPDSEQKNDEEDLEPPSLSLPPPPPLKVIKCHTDEENLEPPSLSLPPPPPPLTVSSEDCWNYFEILDSEQQNDEEDLEPPPLSLPPPPPPPLTVSSEDCWNYFEILDSEQQNDEEDLEPPPLSLPPPNYYEQPQHHVNAISDNIPDSEQQKDEEDLKPPPLSSLPPPPKVTKCHTGEKLPTPPQPNYYEQRQHVNANSDNIPDSERQNDEENLLEPPSRSPPPPPPTVSSEECWNYFKHLDI